MQHIIIFERMRILIKCCCRQRESFKTIFLILPRNIKKAGTSSRSSNIEKKVLF